MPKRRKTLGPGGQPVVKQEVPSPALSQAEASGRSTLSSVPLAASPSPIPSATEMVEEPKPGPWHAVKKFLWRITGTYLWGRLFVLLIFGANDFVGPMGERVSHWFIQCLAFVGFAPTGATRLPALAKVGWLLVAAEFNPLQLLGLATYLLSFPLTIIFLMLFGTVIRKSRAVSLPTKRKRPGLISASRSWPLITVSAFGLLSWYLLYGDSASFRTAFPGVIFSALLFVLLGYRALQGAKPTELADSSILRSIENNAAGWLVTMKDSLVTNLKRPKSEILGALRVNNFQRLFLVRVAAFLRGRKGKDRIYIILVCQFAFSLLLLGASAVLFWAIAIRSASPQQLSLGTSVLLVMSHFLVGVETPHMDAQIPTWASIGPAITALILFGVYVAASASLLPGKQQVYGQRTSEAYSKLRSASLLYSRMYWLLERRP